MATFDRTPCQIPQNLNIPLNKESFITMLIGKLAETIEELVGAEEATGFINIVGESIGQKIDTLYKNALSKKTLSAEEVAYVLVDLKRRIGGGFYIISLEEDKIVLGNHTCPYDNHVVGHPSLCMMTSNVFGKIAAENLGYGQVEIRESIAKGCDECNVTVYLKPKEAGEIREGIEYFRE